MKKSVKDFRTWSELSSIMKFISDHVITNNYKKTSTLAYHMCNLARVVSVNGSMQCHMDMGMYGKDSPQKLVKEIVANMKKSYNEIDVIVVNGDFSAHGTSLKTKHGMPS